MKARHLLWGALAAGCGAALAAPPGEIPAQLLLQRGGCVACHGADLDKPVDASTPRLAGQHPDYLRSAMRAYRIADNRYAGRSHPVMKAVLDQFTLAELDRIAEYIATLPGSIRTAPEQPR